MSTVDGDGQAAQACHDLLVALAGRLPDELLWRLRDWLAAEAAPDRATHDTVSLMLPRELMRHGVGLTEYERDLLGEASGVWGSARRLLDAVLPAHAPDEPVFGFVADPEPTDVAALSLLAVVRGHPGATLLALARRTGANGTRRVVLVRGGDQPWLLTATLQRLLRAHGDHNPCVEVLSAAGEPSAYHRSLAHAAVPIWRGADQLVGATS